MSGRRIQALLQQVEQSRRLWCFREAAPGKTERLDYFGRLADSPLVHEYRLGGRRLIVKLFEERLLGDNRFLLNRTDEVRAMRAAPELAPEVHYPAPDFLVMSRVAGRHPRPEEVAGRDLAGRLARLLAKVHRLPVTLARVDYAGRAEHYLRQLGTAAPAWLDRQLGRELLQRCTEFSLAGPVSPCHHDPVLHNLLADRDGRLRLLDWEYAGAGRPFFDLAAVIEYHRLPSAAGELLLEAWLRETGGRADGRDQLRQLTLARCVYLFLELLWKLLAEGSCRPDARQRLGALVNAP